MSILMRFWTVIKSNLNSIIGRAENPEKILNQMLIDMQEQLIDAKKQVALSIADEKRLAKEFDKENSLAQKWGERAVLAVKSKNDILASQALERKSEHAMQASNFSEQWHAQKTSVEKLKQALIVLNDKIFDAKRKKNLLVARAKRAEAQKTISDTMTGLSSTSAIDTISRMEQKIDKMEAEAQATSELANRISVDTLTNEFKKLETSKVDNALSSLKAKINSNNVLLDNNNIINDKNIETLEQIEKEIKNEIALKK